jgi:hypothetical protein
MKTPKSVWVQLDRKGVPLGVTHRKWEVKEWEENDKRMNTQNRIRRYDLFKVSEKVALGPLLMKKR